MPLQPRPARRADPTGGHPVTILATAGTVGPVSDQGNGSYTAILTAPTLAGSGVITATVLALLARFIGVEPGIKPAITLSPSGRIGVLATPMTLASAKFRSLVDAHAAGMALTLQPCPGLAAEIEKGALDSPALRGLVQRFSAPLLQADVDTAVLGCTHYPLIRPLFEAALPGVRLVDTSGAVARHARRLAQVLVHTGERSAAADAADLTLWTTGDPMHLQSVARQWLDAPTLRARALGD